MSSYGCIVQGMSKTTVNKTENVLPPWSLHSDRGDPQCRKEIRKTDGTCWGGGREASVLEKEAEKGTGRGSGLAAILTEVVGEGCLRS